VVVVGYVLLFWWLAWRKFEFCTAETGDAAVINHMFWTSLHGKFFWHFVIDRSYFAMHQEWLALLFWPLYALFPMPKTLFFVQTFCLGISAVPMFLIARRVLQDEWSALFAAVAVLFFPTVVSQNVNNMHSSPWVLPFLLGAFYFFHVQNFRWFVAFCVWAALGKENTPLTLLAFVPYALWLRRSRGWWIAPTLISVISLVLSFKVVGPYFARGWTYEALGYLSNLGSSWGEIFRSVFLNPPKLLAALFQPANGPFLLYLLQPAVWILPFLAPEILFVVPDLGTNLIAGNTGMKVIPWHYNVNVGGFLVLAAVFAIPRLQRWLQKRYGENVRLTPVVPALLAAMAIAHWPFWFSPAHYRPLPHYEAQVRARAIVPADASLIVGPNLILGPFSSRMKITANNLVNNNPEKMFEYDWAYFDMNYPWYVPPVPRETVMAFANNPDYELVFAEKNVFVFRRRPTTILRQPVNE
jgi:uncharacterized membrane protein